MAHHHPFFPPKLYHAFAALCLFIASNQTTAQTPPKLALCTSCHGAQGVSQNPAFPSLAGQPKVFVENQLVLIREGLRDIPAMKGMLDEMKDPELTALAVYFSKQTPPPRASGPVDATRYLRGQTLAGQAMCGSCHLPSYSGRDQVPRLAHQQEQFLVDAMKSFRDHPGPGRDTIMSDALIGLKDAQLADLAHYFAHHQ
ncbi:MAG: cytochrome c553 [Litorivivens sp.]|jgi:cytochrome c553